MDRFMMTGIWKRTLGPQRGKDLDATPREMLFTEFLRFRDRATLLAAEISRDLPDFSVHDITHVDSLWDMADLIAGPDCLITPTEAFVLGGAFLIHDLGLGLAAFPEGLKDLQKKPFWFDTVALLLKIKLGRTATEEEINKHDPEIENEAKQIVLRALHAEHAKELALIKWKENGNGEEYHLIEDSILRHFYGSIIGRIANSHWWPIDKLAGEFSIHLGTPPGYPREWIVDPLKIASLLRLADACHIDASRAPSFLLTIRKPSKSSRKYWIFQSKLNQPILEYDRLIYTSGSPFSIEDSESWWCCFDTLCMIDTELRGVDLLLADMGRQRMAARGVRGVEEPQRLMKMIPTSNWVPIDTKIKVSDIAGLVNKLGGGQLYGEEKTAALRELIQNSIDAVKARRLCEGRPNDWGRICVRMGQDSDGNWIEVEDNGIGMSMGVLQGPFLDFGKSFWDSDLLLQELPGLSSKRFESIGKFGIGFYSVFMIGEKVRIITRKYDAAQRDTLVLEFGKGLTVRPILRKANDDEFIIEGGTQVRVWLNPPYENEGIFIKRNNAVPLEDICAILCPCIDVNLFIEEKEPKQVIRASDWLTMDNVTFIKRIFIERKYDYPYFMEDEEEHFINIFSDNITLLNNNNGQIIGRAGISAEGYPYSGVVTIGGLRSSYLRGIMGVLIGVPITANRNIARPIINNEDLALWATNQGKKIMKSNINDRIKADIAACIKSCGGDIDEIPISFCSNGWLRAKGIAELMRNFDEILILSFHRLDNVKRYFNSFKLNNNVMCVQEHPSILHHNDISWPGINKRLTNKYYYFINFSLLGYIIKQLSTLWKSLPEEICEASFIEYEKYKDREIGIGDEKAILENVGILKNPKKL
jgi:hypothetical protein